jgi:hypothetical protein
MIFKACCRFKKTKEEKDEEELLFGRRLLEGEGDQERGELEKRHLPMLSTDRRAT